MLTVTLYCTLTSVGSLLVTASETNRVPAGASVSKNAIPTPDTNPVSMTSIDKITTSSIKVVTTTIFESSGSIVSQTTQNAATTAQTTTTTTSKDAPQTTITKLQTSATVRTTFKATPTAATTPQRATGTILPNTRPIGTTSGNFSETAVTEQLPDWIIYAAVGGSVGALLLLMIVISLLVWNRRKKKMHASHSRSTAEELFNPIFQTEGYIRAGTLVHRDLNTVAKSTMEERSFADDESFGDESDPGDNADVYTDVMKKGEKAPTRYEGRVSPQAKPPMSTFMS